MYVNTKLYVFTTTWYRNKMYLFLYARMQREAAGPDTPDKSQKYRVS